MSGCNACPRRCGVDRTTAVGACGVGAAFRVARMALHAWEEPCISGKSGSGAIFFSGCPLKCVFCQNMEISRGCKGVDLTEDQLIAGMQRLIDAGAQNINLVSPTQYAPALARLLRRWKPPVPVVYNTGGYERLETLRQLEGLIDIYLPDLKYLTPELAAAYSHAPDYPQYAMEAISEMVRQQPQAEFMPEDRTEVSPIMRRGVIVRHLLLPGHVREAKKVVGYLHETYGDQIYISMMNQYTPMSEKFADPNLNRRVTKREYERLLDYAAEIGVENGFYQEGATADESFIPEFDYEGVRKK